MSTPFVGRDKIYVGFAKEATRGTGVAAANWYAWQALDFKPVKGKVTDNSAFGVLEETSDVALIEESSAGKLSGRVRDQGIGYMLYNLAGGYSVANHAGETTVKDHTFTENQSATPQSLTITRVDPSLDEKYANGMVKQFELDITQGKFVTMSADLMASVGVTSTDTPTVAQENAFTSKHCIVTLASNVAGLSGGTVAIIKSLKFTMNRNVENWFGVGQNAPYDIYAGKWNLTGDMTLRYLDNTYEQLDFTNATNAMWIDMKNTDINIGVVPSHPELKFQFNKLMFQNWTPDQNIDKVNEQTLSFSGMLDFTTGAGWQAVLTNTMTTY